MPQTLERKKIFTNLDTIRSEQPTTLDGPRKSIRPELFKPNSKKAMYVLGIGILFQIFSYSVLSVGLFYDQMAVIVLGWLLTGMSVTSLFVIGHDCAHGSFLKNQKLNHIIGHISLLFSFYPYFGWKHTHNAHHAHTNDLSSNTKDVYFDNAWIPFTVHEYLALKKVYPVRAFLYKMTRFFPPIGSLLHNIVFHAFPSKLIKSHRKDLYISYFILGAGLSILSLGLWYVFGTVFAILHFLIIPALFFQFWMSYYTFLHHTSNEIQFYKPKDWNPYLGQIVSTYNSLSPKWLSFLHFHIDIHTPHHLSTAIPCYHLKEAYEDLKKSKFSIDLKEGKMSFTYLWNQLMQCHVYDAEANVYRRFREVE
ncbi:MAG: fatty acid desaturase [Leptospira sp.]|nr:fatty acid desaturase [Leptospira sp.]